MSMSAQAARMYRSPHGQERSLSVLAVEKTIPDEEQLLDPNSCWIDIVRAMVVERQDNKVP